MEPAVRRAAPSRNSNQRVGLDSLHSSLRLEGYASGHFQVTCAGELSDNRFTLYIKTMWAFWNHQSMQKVCFLVGKIRISHLQDSAIRLHISIYHVAILISGICIPHYL